MKIDLSELMSQKDRLVNEQEGLSSLATNINGELDNVCNNVKSSELVNSLAALKDNVSTITQSLNNEIVRLTDFMGIQLKSYQVTNESATTALNNLVQSINGTFDASGNVSASGTAAVAGSAVGIIGTKKSADQIVGEVINGQWGNGDERKNSLTVAGYNPEEIQQGVNDQLYGPGTTSVKYTSGGTNGGTTTGSMTSGGTTGGSSAGPTQPPVAGGSSTPATGSKTTDEIASEVISGKWGTGDERKQRLIEAGYDPSEVQQSVNKQLYGSSGSTSSGSSASSGGSSTSGTSTGGNSGGSSSGSYSPAVTNPKYKGQTLTKSAGRIEGPSGQETYYNLNMSGVIKLCKNSGISLPGEYWVRSDGVKMLGDYVMVAANLNTHPRGSYVDTSLGKGIVVDTGGFAASNPTQLDIAVAW